jgi:L-threonylcarbamoyladenylate synthase
LVADIVAAAEALRAAAALVAAGEVVAIPTETVYGLAGDAGNGVAVARIFEAKGRPRFNPLIVHVSSLDMAERIGVFDGLARRLANAFWPGPLTLVVPLRADAPVHDLVTASLPTVAIRMPKGFAAELIAATGRPLAAPSANRSGRVSPTSASAVAGSLGERIRLIVDGGTSSVGVESTIVKPEDGRLLLLRPGGLAAEDIEAVAGATLERTAGAAIQAPGMMASHYAPQARVRIDADVVRPGEALLAFGPKRIAGAQDAAAMRNLSPSGDLREAAANLFAFLLALDAASPAGIAVEPVPHTGLGEAINDRLRRAAAPRPAP